MVQLSFMFDATKESQGSLDVWGKRTSPCGGNFRDAVDCPDSDCDVLGGGRSRH